MIVATFFVHSKKEMVLLKFWLLHTKIAGRGERSGRTKRHSDFWKSKGKRGSGLHRTAAKYPL